MRVPNCKNDGLMRKPQYILTTTIHELAHDSVICACVSHLLFNVRSLERQLFEQQAFFPYCSLQWLWQRVPLYADYLKSRLCLHDAVIDKISFRDGLFVRVIERRQTVLAPKESKGVVIDVVSRSCCKAQMEG